MDPNSNGAHFLPHGVNPFVVPHRFAANPTDYTPMGTMTGPQTPIYQPPPVHRPGEIQTSPVEYPPITPPHLTHSRRGSRESGDTSSSNSTPSSGPHKSTLVQRHKRGAASGSSNNSSSPIAIRKSRQAAKKKDEDEDEDEAMSDGENGLGTSTVRREDAKKSRQDAEQKRRDQLKYAYDQLRGTVPGTSEKTSKVVLVNHARQYIEKLTVERERLRFDLGESSKDLSSLQKLNERLMAKLAAHNIDFEEDLRATHMEITPDDRPKQPPVVGIPAPGHVAAPTQPQQPAPGGSHRPGHLRTSPSVNAAQPPLQAPTNEAGMPMSAPAYTRSLPDFPPLPTSTPASPQKASLGMAPPIVIPPASSAPGVALSYPMGGHPMPSPSSSASSSAPRQSIYSPEGNLVYSDDPSSSESYRGSAMSSQVGVNVTHMSLQEQQAQLRLQQPQHGSTPQSPSQRMVAFGGSEYMDPTAPYGPEAHYELGGPYGNAGLGLNVPGHAEGMPSSSADVYTMSHDLNGMPQIPGAFPHDDAFSYQHAQLGRPTLQTSPSFGGPVGMVYPGSHDGHAEFGQQPMMFGGDSGDPYFNATSLPPPGSPSGHQPPQYSATTTNGVVPHLSISLGASPHHLEPSGRSPLPLPSPLGSYPDISGRSDGGIAPSALVGSPSGAAGIRTPLGEKHGDAGASIDGTWYRPDSFSHS